MGACLTMITVILYGRNDQHGYNYHKRVALSLNCLAHVLTDPLDEILFVDYNTADDLPTLLESIQDTLTKNAKSRIKIIRVRNEHHCKAVKYTPLPVLEALARNIAIRRSNPSNRWILSTNSDMVFVPCEKYQSLSSIAKKLSDGFYTLPRFELPEYFWESSFERNTPKQNIALLRAQSEILHLNKVIHHNNYIVYNNAGDFQLMLREDIFKMGGFNQDMLLAWHIDSNLSKRMYISYTKIDTLVEKIRGYHCNHANREKYFNQKNQLENSWRLFVEDINSPIANLSIEWGIPNIDLEEIILSDATQTRDRFLKSLSAVQTQTKANHYESTISLDYFNCLFYSSAQIFSYLADHLANLPLKSNITYIGYNYILLNMLRLFWKQMGFTGSILLANEISTPDNFDNTAIKYLESKNILAQSNLYIFDFGFDESTSTNDAKLLLSKRKDLKNIMHFFLSTVRHEKRRTQSRKFVGINVIYTDFKPIFKNKIDTHVGSHSTNISYGYVKIKSNIFTSKLKQKNYYLMILFKKLSQYCHYVIVRFFYNYSDQFRNRFVRLKIAKYFIKIPKEISK